MRYLQQDRFYTFYDSIDSYKVNNKKHYNDLIFKFIHNKVIYIRNKKNHYLDNRRTNAKLFKQNAEIYKSLFLYKKCDLEKVNFDIAKRERNLWKQ